MFEILKAMRDLNTACLAHGTSLRWDVLHEPGGEVAIKAEIPLTDEDVQFIEGMRAMFAPVEP